jgi:copper(I)-binding protein
MHRIFALLACLLVLSGCARQAEGPLAFDDARVRALLPGTDKTVGYFRVRNTSQAPVVLVGARAPGVRAVEFHTTTRDGDTVRMRRLQEVVLAPGETADFSPGGRHLMLFGVTTLPERLPITLVDAGGAEYVQEFTRFDGR